MYFALWGIFKQWVKHCCKEHAWGLCGSCCLLVGEDENHDSDRMF